MKLRNPRIWLAFLSTLAVLAVTMNDIDRTSPGPLSAVHGRDPKLAGGSGCSDCHGGWTETMAEACLDCHADVSADLDGGEGLHGSIGEDKASLCALCHSEHHGADFEIVNRQSFFLAGFEDPEAFDHWVVGFAMDGKHLELACTECHDNAEADVLQTGQKRFMGLEQDCASCHEDAHEGRMVLACVSCHGQESFDVLESVDHAEVLPLIGPHADVACGTCHAEGEPHALEILGGAGAKARRRECASCHETPHAKGFLRGIGKLLQQNPSGTCGSCHEGDHTSFRDERLELSREEHVRSGFALAAPHADVGCEACHPTELDFEGRYPGREADSCSSCHEDVHGGQFADGPFGAGGCLACHERRRFEPHAFDVDLHARLALPLTGAHTKTACADCHTERLTHVAGAPRAFVDTAPECSACHEDAHLGAFDGRSPQAPAATSDVRADVEPTCERCHDTTDFAGEEDERFDHAAWTPFPVLGAHAQEGCASCHPRSTEADRFGRTFGRIAEHFGPFEGCVTCHEDVHRGGFDDPAFPVEVDGREGCARCHVQSSFRTFYKGFEHETWTGFALEDAHAAAACTDCHAPTERPDAFGRRWGHAPGSDCSACHDNVHGEQFELFGRTDCARCHASAKSFTQLIFDHTWDSRFPLEGAHAELDCAACHTAPTAGDPLSVRYKPLGTDCVDCHGANASQLRRRQGGRK